MGQRFLDGHPLYRVGLKQPLNEVPRFLRRVLPVLAREAISTLQHGPVGGRVVPPVKRRMARDQDICHDAH